MILEIISVKRFACVEWLNHFVKVNNIDMDEDDNYRFRLNVYTW
jgi:hypothetical protein